jgi:hypothetical protein
MDVTELQTLVLNLGMCVMFALGFIGGNLP